MANSKMILRLTILVIICALRLISLESADIEGRIIHGKPAYLGQFPWQVILKENDTLNYRCGASLIAKKWVLTAAHCVDDVTAIYTMFGSITVHNPLAQGMSSNEIYIHQDYNRTILANDLALIKLPQEVKLNKYVKIIPLVSPKEKNNSFVGQYAIIEGFGNTHDGVYETNSEVLLYAHIEIIDNKKCEKYFGSKIVTPATMCGDGLKNNASICNGDSGGPMVTHYGRGKYFQLGVNSFVAQGMCDKGYPSGFKRLTYFLDWIANITGLPFDKVKND